MSSAGPGDVFDIKKIRRLVELMEQHGLSEIDLEQGEQRVRLRRNRGEAASEAVPYAPPPTPSAATPAAAAPTKPAAADSASEESKFALIKSPMVGTFYSAPNPDSPDFVKVGDHVGPDTTVCIVEAMKVFNEIPAEMSGKIVAMMVENGDPVDFGQPLFKVDAAA